MARLQGQRPPVPAPSPTPAPKTRPEASQAPSRATEGVAAGKVVALPVDLTNEQILIAAAILDPDLRAKWSRLFTPEHFLHHEHRPIWRTIQECERLRLEWSSAIAERAGISATLLDAILAGGIRPNLDHHVKLLLWDKAKMSAALGPLSALVEALRDPKAEPARMRALARHVGEAFDKPTSSDAIDDPEDLRQRVTRSLDDAARTGAPPPLGIPGLDRHDDGSIRITAGSAPGKITVLTGVSGSGKSTVAMQMLLGQRGVLTSAGTQRKVLAGVWEMGTVESAKLLVCQHLGWSRYDLRVRGCGPSGRPLREVPEEKAAFDEAMDEILSFVRFWPRPPSQRRKEKTKQLQNDANFDWMRQVISDSGCDLVLMDLFRFGLASTEPSDEDDFLNKTRRMADEDLVHLVLGAQQLIKGEHGVSARNDKRPTQGGVKGSGGWTEMADTSVGVFRAALHKRVPDDKVQAIGLKQRFGIFPFAVELDFDAPSGRISGGMEIPYDQPGEVSNDLDAMPINPPKRGRHRDL